MENTKVRYDFSSTISEDSIDNFVRLDVPDTSFSFSAIKKYLGEKGPFSTSDRKAFTLSEKTSNDSTDTARIESVQLVLGYGIHSFPYKNSTIYVRYKEPSFTTSADHHEKITLYAPPSTSHASIGDLARTSSIDTESHKTNPIDLLRSFVHDALQFEQTEDQDTTKIYTINEKSLSWHKATERPKRPVESVFLRSDLKDDILNDMDVFLKNKEFYAYHGISFKRGYMLHGPPGCGKSSLVAALAAKFGLGICLLQIGHKGVTDNVLHNLFMTSPTRSIILIEDIDSLFSARQTTNAYSSVTFSGFINAIDGVGSAEGKIIIITTNDPDKLDTALLRPGRIDKKYKIDYPEKDEIEAMFLKYFPEKTKKATLFRDSVVGNNVTSAEIQQHFIKYQYSSELACKQRYELVDSAAARDKKKQEDGKTNTTQSFVSLW